MDTNQREKIARAIWAKRPDCQNKPWPIETPEQRRAYPHNPIAACDLCFIYADAAIDAMRSVNREAWAAYDVSTENAAQDTLT